MQPAGRPPSRSWAIQRIRARDAGRGGEAGARGEPGGRDVDGVDGEPAPGEPHRDGAATAGDVERASGDRDRVDEVGGAHQDAGRGGRRRPGGGVPRVPPLPVGVAHPASASRRQAVSASKSSLRSTPVSCRVRASAISSASVRAAAGVAQAVRAGGCWRGSCAPSPGSRRAAVPGQVRPRLSADDSPGRSPTSTTTARAPSARRSRRPAPPGLVRQHDRRDRPAPGSRAGQRASSAARRARAPPAATARRRAPRRGRTPACAGQRRAPARRAAGRGRGAAGRSSRSARPRCTSSTSSARRRAAAQRGRRRAGACTASRAAAWAGAELELAASAARRRRARAPPGRGWRPAGPATGRRRPGVDASPSTTSPSLMGPPGAASAEPRAHAGEPRARRVGGVQLAAPAACRSSRSIVRQPLLELRRRPQAQHLPRGQHVLEGQRLVAAASRRRRPARR